jgi:hypothetical protein
MRRSFGRRFRIRLRCTPNRCTTLVPDLVSETMMRRRRSSVGEDTAEWQRREQRESAPVSTPATTALRSPPFLSSLPRSTTPIKAPTTTTAPHTTATARTARTSAPKTPTRPKLPLSNPTPLSLPVLPRLATAARRTATPLRRLVRRLEEALMGTTTSLTRERRRRSCTPHRVRQEDALSRRRRCRSETRSGAGMTSRLDGGGCRS